LPSLVPTITGAQDALDTVASNAFKPLDAAAAEPGALFGVPERRAHRVLDIEVADRLAGGDDRGVPR